MNVERVARILDFVGVLIPSVLELTLLVPTFFGLYYAAKSLGFEVDLGAEVVMGISVTFSWFAWVTLNSWCYRGAERSAEATNQAPRDSDSSSVSHRPLLLEARQPIECPAAPQPKEEMDSVAGK